jgi:hypothetical protein
MSSLAQSAALEELAGALERFLPGTPHPFGNPDLSFPAVAQSIGLADCWAPQGNKRQRIRLLLDGALRKGRFNGLLTEIVKRSMTHHAVTRDEILLLNRLVERVGYKIPELRDPHFLNSLPGGGVAPTQTHASASLHELIAKLAEQYKQMRLLDENPQARGFAFEKFLSELFGAFGLSPRGSFRLKGEQIDGSFTLAAETYLLEAKWRAKPADKGDLVEFSGTVGAKARWSRGLFISQSGFTTDGLEAYALGRQTNIVCMNGAELQVILINKLNLPEVIAAKVRRAAETNHAFVPVWDLFADLVR